MSLGDQNLSWAGVFLDELARCGVREICVAPGSRSTPLILAASRDKRFRTFSIIDERSAGFYALGIGKSSGRPAVVITTSGTAAANLYPAVIEASQGEVPLLVLTADRPHRLRDTDGNQAMDQLRLFGAFPRAFFEVSPPSSEERALRHLRGLAARSVALATGSPRGPVHLNFPFEKPLEPAGDGIPVSEEEWLAGRAEDEPFVRVHTGRSSVSADEIAAIKGALEAGRHGVIVAGPVPNPDEVGPAVLALGEATGFPILADSLSGARFSRHGDAQVVGGYDLFLRSPSVREALAPDLVVRIGGSPTSRGVQEFLAEAADAWQLVVDDGHRWKDHVASAHTYVHASPGPFLDRVSRDLQPEPDPGWRGLWQEAEDQTRAVVAGLGQGELLEGELLAAVTSGLPEGANLLVASSMPIRDLDAFAFPETKKLRVFGNRGVSGIDGLVSTTLGIAAGSSGDGPTVGVLGDLAFFHDMNGLLTLKSNDLPVIFVVVNNDGGGIFHTLPVSKHEPAFSKFFTTPHGLDFGRVAGLYGIPYFQAETLEAFNEQFSQGLARSGSAIVEVRTRRAETHERREQVVAAVVEAVGGLGRGGSS